MKTIATASIPSRLAFSIAEWTDLRIELRLDASVNADALVDLDDALIELFGKDDLLGENIGPSLVGDAKRIAETLGDQEQYAVALALEQRIGGNGRAHFDVADQPAGIGAP